MYIHVLVITCSVFSNMSTKDTPASGVFFHSITPPRYLKLTCSYVHQPVRADVF